MHPNSIPYTAFRVPWGLFEFTRLPQGLCTSPGTFQRVMELIFGDMNMLQLLLYLDDVLVFASSYEEHITRLDEVLRRLIEAGLKLNGKKCKFFQTKLTLNQMFSLKSLLAQILILIVLQTVILISLCSWKHLKCCLLMTGWILIIWKNCLHLYIQLLLDVHQELQEGNIVILLMSHVLSLARSCRA